MLLIWIQSWLNLKSIKQDRVVGTNGSLTGYAGGIDKKIALLKHEGVDMTRYFKPKAR